MSHSSPCRADVSAAHTHTHGHACFPVPALNTLVPFGNTRSLSACGKDGKHAGGASNIRSINNYA